LFRFGAAERFRQYSFCPSFWKYDMPIGGLVFLTIIPCRTLAWDVFLAPFCRSLVAPISSARNALG
jgi:hypothetical protein